MLLKKKYINYKYINSFKNFFSKLVYILGLISLSLIIIVTIYYFTSGINVRYPGIQLIKKIDKVILDRHIGFSIFKIGDYIKIKSNNLRYIFTKNKLEEVIIKIDQQNLYNLELQRQQRLGKLGSTKDNLYNFSNAEMILNGETYPIKLRVKGDRSIHWHDKNKTSYKIDLRGSKRIWGLEEFSVQKPITRNYTYEFLFHKMLEFNNLLSLKYFFINLSLNDTKQGVYAVEEGFSKELIERNKKRNGPIFGIDEIISDSPEGIVFPNVLFDLYSKDYWLSNHPKLTESAISKLNRFKNGEINSDKIFDLEKWATYFAITDLTNAYHGAISKSVKFYYNPATSKFEPIGFDAHISTNYTNDFLLIDFLDSKNKNCTAICYDRNWFLSFFKNIDGELNDKFIDYYLNKLEKFSTEIFLQKFDAKYSEKINFFNSQVYSDNSKTDQGGMYEGFGLFIYNNKLLSDRAQFIRNRIKNINDIGYLQYSLKQNKIIFDNLNKSFFKKLNISCKKNKDATEFIYGDIEIDYQKDCKYAIGNRKINPIKNIFILKNKLETQYKKLTEFDEIENIDGIYYLNKNIEIKNNYFFPKDKKLIIKSGVKINFKNDSVIFSEGSIIFEGSNDKPIIIDGQNGTGSLVLYNNFFSFDNVILKNLSYPKNASKILYGGINIIESNLSIHDMVILNSNSEDAINIISSNSLIKNLKVKNIFADAIDIDFGNLEFENINCENISNDCFDVSGAMIYGKILKGDTIKDKGLSFGENSSGTISNLEINNAKLGVAVKDGSKLILSNYKLENNEYDLAVFNKKNEYESSSLNIDNSVSDTKLKYLIGFKNQIKMDNILLEKKIDNKTINNLFY